MNDGDYHVYPFEDRVTFEGVTFPVVKKGITRRDWLAGLAMQGMLAANHETTIEDGRRFGEALSQAAYSIADYMINEGGHHE